MSVVVLGNKIFLSGEICARMPKRFARCLADLQQTGPVELWVSSCGGCMHAVYEIVQMLKNLRRPIIGKIHKTKSCDGVASAASVLCSQLSRVCIAHDATFMIHFSNKGERKIDVDFWVEMTGNSHDVIKDLMLAEYEMSAEEAAEMGFVHEIFSC
jgi:ATP-dependent protease ClpP protease subunit